MAQLLDGNSGHATYAPVTASQTIAISRHLQDQIRKAEGRLDDLETFQARTNTTMNAAKESGDDVSHKLSSVQDILALTRSSLDATRKELGRSDNQIQRLHAGLDQAKEDLGSSRDAQKVTTISLKKMTQDLHATHNLAVKLQESIERRLDVDVAHLRDELSKTNLDLKHLRADEGLLKASLHDEREALRETKVKTKLLFDKFADQATVVSINEQRLNDTSAGQKATRQTADDLNNMFLQMQEDYDNTANIVSDMQLSFKRLASQVKQTDDTMQGSTMQLMVTQGRKLEEQLEQMDLVRRGLADTQSKVQGLQDGYDTTSSSINQLRGDMMQVSSTTQAVKAGLKETTSLLLPNINKDSAEARACAARHGSLLQGPSKSSISLSSSGGGNGFDDSSGNLLWT